MKNYIKAFISLFNLNGLLSNLDNRQLGLRCGYGLMILVGVGMLILSGATSSNAHVKKKVEQARFDVETYKKNTLSVVDRILSE